MGKSPAKNMKVKTESPKELATRLYNEAIVNKKGIGTLSYTKDDFKFVRKIAINGTFEENGYDDTSFTIIDKDGTEHALTPFDPPNAWKEVDLRKSAYIRVYNADGVYDSLGYSDNFESTSQRQKYEEEINRLFKAKW